MAKPDTASLNDYLKELTEWEIFGIYLPGIKNHHIEKIKKDNEGIDQQKKALFVKWLDVYPSATYGDVVNALKKAEKFTLAEDVERKCLESEIVGGQCTDTRTNLGSTSAGYFLQNGLQESNPSQRNETIVTDTRTVHPRQPPSAQGQPPSSAQGQNYTIPVQPTTNQQPQSTDQPEFSDRLYPIQSNIQVWQYIYNYEIHVNKWKEVYLERRKSISEKDAEIQDLKKQLSGKEEEYDLLDQKFKTVEAEKDKLVAEKNKLDKLMKKTDAINRLMQVESLKYNLQQTDQWSSREIIEEQLKNERKAVKYLREEVERLKSKEEINKKKIKNQQEQLAEQGRKTKYFTDEAERLKNELENQKKIIEEQESKMRDEMEQGFNQRLSKVWPVCQKLKKQRKQLISEKEELAAENRELSAKNKTLDQHNQQLIRDRTRVISEAQTRERAFTKEIEKLQKKQ